MNFLTQAFKSIFQHTLYPHVWKVWKWPGFSLLWFKFKSDCNKYYVESDCISLLCDWFNNVKYNKFLFFYLFHCNLKKKTSNIRRKISSIKMFICKISIIILICWKLGLVDPIQLKINLSLDDLQV